jgi:hypothetical protein
LKIIRTAIATALFTAVSLSAWAHGGEDHGGEAAPVVSGSMAPRAIAQTDEFELVAVLVGKTLTLTLDRFATNEPVADAQIEVESGSTLKAVAKQVSPGVYTLQSELFATPGKYPLAISVQAGESADLLATTLDLSAPTAAVEPVHARTKWAVWGAAGALLLAGAAMVAALKRKRKSSTQ